MKCELCNKNFDSLVGLSVHLNKYHDISKKNYYDKYLKKDNEGKCYFCGNDAKFLNIKKGYHRICDSVDCLGKTRATSTSEFLMYKYGINKEDAILLNKKKSKERGKIIKKSLNDRFKENPNFFKEKSHQTLEYWLKRGYSEEDSKEKVREVLGNLHKKTWEKRRKNPDLYDDINTTQIKYWLKKGYSEEDSIKKIKQRQRTFTLKYCIDKYGEEQGIKIFNDRQRKWSEKIEKMYQDGKFSKFPKEPYSKPEIELFDSISIKMNIKDKVHYGNDQFFRYFSDLKQTFSYDFVFNKKLIEFNGDYWHCNPLYYNSNYFHQYLQMFAYQIWDKDKIRIDAIKGVGFDVLEIWESEYKQNKEKIIHKCIEFLNR